MELEGAFFDISDYKKTNTRLGKGAFGEVFIVKKNSDESLYAAKIINIGKMFTGEEQQRLIRESSILHNLKHPAIVKFYGINFHSFTELSDFQPIKLEPTILTEYLKNGSLKDILNKEQNGLAGHGWNATKKCICLIGIADAMLYLHGESILHRDLKPENILFDENYYPRICDFGLSRCFADVLSRSMQFSMSGAVGTPLYMAPELMDSDESHFTIGIDVYAFAMIMYEIVSGQEPFIENGKQISFAKLQTKILSGERPKLVDGITKPMRNLLTRCWSKFVNERPSFDEIFKELSTNFSYFDEDIDEEEVKNYLDYLNDEKIFESEMNKTSKKLMKQLDKLSHNKLKKKKKKLII